MKNSDIFEKKTYSFIAKHFAGRRKLMIERDIEGVAVMRNPK